MKIVTWFAVLEWILSQELGPPGQCMAIFVRCLNSHLWLWRGSHWQTMTAMVAEQQAYFTTWHVKWNLWKWERKSGGQHERQSITDFLLHAIWCGGMYSCMIDGWWMNNSLHRIYGYIRMCVETWHIHYHYASDVQPTELSFHTNLMITQCAEPVIKASKLPPVKVFQFHHSSVPYRCLMLFLYHFLEESAVIYASRRIAYHIYGRKFIHCCVAWIFNIYCTWQSMYSVSLFLGSCFGWGRN